MLLQFILAYLGVAAKSHLVFDVIAVAAKATALDFTPAASFTLSVVSERVASCVTDAPEFTMLMKQP